VVFPSFLSSRSSIDWRARFRTLIATVTDLELRGVGLRSPTEHIDTTTPGDRLPRVAARVRASQA